MTKKLIINLVSIAILFSACQPSIEGLEAKRSLLNEKTATMRTLQSEIEILHKEIDALSPEKKRDSVMVHIETLTPKAFVRKVNLQGSVVSEDMAFASSETGGKIISLNVKEGQQVQKGSLIARIDMETISKQMDEIRTSLELANTVYERQKRLWEQQIGSEMQYLQAESNKNRLEKSLKTLESQLSKSKVYAPISGVVEKEFLSAGEIAGPGTPIVEILDTKKVKVKADVSEQYLGSIRKGDKVQLFFPALNTEVASKVTLIGASIDPSNRTFEIEANLNNTKGIYKPNLLAEMEFVDFENDESIVIPLELIQEDVSGRKYVYTAVKDADNRQVAKKAYITLGPSYQGEVLIEEGLSSGDQIVTVGGRSLVEGNYLAPTN